MLIGNKFIFIHVPRTGGNFLRGCLDIVRRNTIGFWLRICRAAVTRTYGLILTIIVSIGPTKVKNKKDWIGQKETILRKKISKFFPEKFPLESPIFYIHAHCRKIPKEHSHKTMISLMRDPLAYYISCYFYHSGRKEIVGGGGEIYKWGTAYLQQQSDCSSNLKTRYQRINEISFCDFLYFYIETLTQIKCSKWMNINLQSSIGFLTFIYIWYFFKNPHEIFTKNDNELENYFQSGEYKLDKFPVTFLRTENLNEDLYDFLSQTETQIDKQHFQFILSKNRMNASKRTDYRKYYNNKLIDYVKEKDRFYYRYFYNTDT